MATTNTSESKHKNDIKFSQQNKTTYQDKMIHRYKAYGSNQRHSDNGFQVGNSVRPVQAMDGRRRGV